MPDATERDFVPAALPSRPLGFEGSPAGPSRADAPAPARRWGEDRRTAGADVLKVAAASVTAALAITALYVGRELLVPLTLAFLLGFVLEPAVMRLKRLGLPRALSVAVVVSLLVVLVGIALVVLSGQVRALSAELPRYQATIRAKVQEINRTLAAPGLFDGAAQTLATVREEVATSQASSATPKVQVVATPAAPLEQAMAWLGWVSGPLTSAGIAFVFLVLILLDRQDLRDRLLRLLGGNLHRTTDVMDEASARISKYLLMQLLVNASYGVPMGVGLWLIGVPGALLWGVVAALMRFIPFVGPFISAVLPVTLAFAVDPGWTMLIWTVALIVALEVLSNNVVEPWLYGASTGLSAISLIAAATFWALLWGPVGLVIATPLTVCLLVFGRHLPGLQFVEVLLGSRPVLDAPTRFYQRLIAGDVEEVVDMAEDHVAARGVPSFYSEIAIPALRLASLHHSHVADAEHRHRVLSGLERAMSELQDGTFTPVDSGAVAVAMGGKWEMDALAARMVAHALVLDGVPTRVIEGDITRGRFFEELDLQEASVLCLSLFAQEPQAQVRYLCRRLRRRWPDLRIVVAAWHAPPDALAGQTGVEIDAVASTLEEAVVRMRQLVDGPAVQGFQLASVPEDEAQRMKALRLSGALGEQQRRTFDRMAKRAADIFDVPIALVTLLDEHWQHVAGSNDPHGDAGDGAIGTPSASAVAFHMPRPMSVCGHVICEKKMLMIEDIARDPRFAGNSMLQAKRIRFYAGAPLIDPAGHVFGTLCVMDTKPRRLREREARVLQAMAQDLMDVLSAAPVPQPATMRPAEAPSATVGQPVPE